MHQLIPPSLCLTISMVNWLNWFSNYTSSLLLLLSAEHKMEKVDEQMVPQTFLNVGLS